MTNTFDRLKSALADRYAIEEELGAGGMATVYLAEDLKHHRKVAVKVLRPELAAVLGAERFVQEIETTANLQHRHILPLFDWGEADSFLYYVMPFIEGETLRDKLNRETQLGIEEAVKITTEVADALDYAHRSNVIHRDIKPENILLHDGRPMVADFGIALAVSAAAGGRMTETGMSLGTPHYMSPEQATAEKDLTNRSDIYSLGCVLYEMLTGEPPHVGSSAQQIVMKIVSEDVQPVAELRKSVPPNVAAATAKSLEKLAADRFATAKEFAEAITNPAFTLPQAPGAAPAMVRPTDWRQRIAIPISGLAVVLGALLGWSLLQRDAESTVGVIRSTIPLLEGHVFTGGVGSVVLSPDGSRLAFRARDTTAESSDPALFVRNLNELNARALPGTANASRPFFSPDGQWLGFVQNGTLRKVDLAGGSPVTVADGIGIDGIWASWGPDDYIVFVTAGKVSRIAAGGGSTPELLVAGEEIGRPEVLPDGTAALVHIGFTRSAELGVVSFETGEVTRLGLRGRHPQYVSQGFMVYTAVNGQVRAVPFDAKRRRVIGEPVALLEAGAEVAVSRSGMLVSVSSPVVIPRRELIWVARDGTEEPVDPTWNEPFTGVALSPDGSRLVVDIAGDHLWIKDLPRGPRSRVAVEGVNQRPTWTPDGRAVTFVSDRRGNYDLYTKRVDGGGDAELLLDRESSIYESDWSPDGQWLVFREGNIGVQADIMRVRPGLDSLPTTAVATPAAEYHPRLSRDGRWLAYTSFAEGRADVFVRSFPNTDSVRVLISTDGGGVQPVWSHSGRELYYWRSEESVRPLRYSGRELLVAVTFTTDPTFTVVEETVLLSFAGRYGESGGADFDVAPDDGKFLLIRDAFEPSTTERKMTLIQNLFEELKAKVGN